MFDRCLSPVMFLYVIVCSVMLCVTAYQITQHNMISATQNPDAWWRPLPDPRQEYPRRRLKLTLHPIHDYHDFDWYKQLREMIRFDSSVQRELYRARQAATPATSTNFWHRDWLYPGFADSIPVGHTGANLPKHVGSHGDSYGGISAGWKAARGWVACAGALALLILLLRLGEKCADTWLSKLRRRNSGGSLEWPVADVRATTERRSETDNTNDHPDVLCNINSAENRSVDPPPPYSTCTNMEPDVRGVQRDLGDTLLRLHKMANSYEEPPPPYSACAFYNPKDGTPSVHLYNGQNANLMSVATSAEIVDNDLPPAPETLHVGDSSCENGTKCSYRTIRSRDNTANGNSVGVVDINSINGNQVIFSENIREGNTIGCSAQIEQVV